ncbi:MAG: YybH family protein [Acidimicrobiales bacterium]
MRRTMWVCVALVSCAAPGASPADARREIGEQLARSARDWNRGDLDGFMADYARDSMTGYVVRGHVQYGWQALYDSYQSRYFAPGKARDSLSFEEVAVRSLGPATAFATARFALHRGDSLVASGPFTIVLEKRAGGWLIVHDHSSSDPRP